MVERLVLPNRTGATKKLINAVRRSALEALQNVDERIWPAIRITERHQQKVDMIGHDYDGVQSSSLALLAKTVIKNQVTCRCGQNEGP